MNDRVSTKPPSLYTKEIEWSQSHLPGPQNHQDVRLDGMYVSYDAGIEVSKPTGMFRFGRALVNAFRPVAAWRTYNSSREERNTTLSPEKAAMEERKAQAEKEYAELKKQGFKGTRRSPALGESVGVPTVKFGELVTELEPSSYQDSSAVCGFDSEQCPKISSDGGLRGPQTITSRQFETPTPSVSSPAKISSYFSKPSFQNLKRVKSHVQLPAAERQASRTSLDPSTRTKDTATTDITSQNPRLQMSKKELAKQQKLNRKISNLESQLESARRNLKLSMQSPSPDLEIRGQNTLKPLKFKGLPSLPSERALNQKRGDNRFTGLQVETQPIQPTLSEHDATNRLDHSDAAIESDSATQLDHELRNFVNMYSSSKKRKSDGEIIKEARRISRKTLDENLKGAPTRDASLAEHISMPNLRTKRKPSAGYTSTKSRGKFLTRAIPPPPQNSPSIVTANAPRIPTGFVDPDPKTADQDAVSALHSSCGKSSLLVEQTEAIFGQQGEIPAIPELRLSERIESSREDGKITDHTSVSHHKQPAIPFLAPPRSTSQMNVEPVKAVRHQEIVRPSRHSLNHPALAIFDENARTMATRSSMNLPKAESQPLSPISTSNVSVQTYQPSRVEDSKALPLIQKEDYEWPEDVF